jgi:hypothetical protein
MLNSIGTLPLRAESESTHTESGAAG